MKSRISSVVTRHGDRGKTSLADGERYNKFDPSIELVGVLDEANAALGLASVLIQSPWLEELRRVQSRLFDVGAAVALSAVQTGWDQELSHLEAIVEKMNSPLEPLKEFVLPGSNEISARLHVARTIARRSERLFWKAANEQLRSSTIGAYLNRVSDYLFVLSRVLSDEEVLWEPMMDHNSSPSSAT